MLRTKTKLRIARGLNRLIMTPRKLAGQGAHVESQRNGITWQLDLNEGIDLAIYLGLYQRLPRRVLTELLVADILAVDIGANIGSHSLQIARAVGAGGHIISVEPTAYAYAKLRANIASNPSLSNRLIPIQAALGDESRERTIGEFYSRWPLHDTGHLHPEHLGKFETANGARQLTLDGLLDEVRTTYGVHRKVAFVKIDVDGNELSVMRGGRRTFSADRPVLLVEIAPHVQDEVRDRFEDLIALIHALDYRLEEARSGGLLPVSAPDLRRIIKFGASIDVIARPIEPAM